MVLENSFKKVTTIAPEMLVFVNNTREILYCPKCDRKVNFNNYIQSVNIDNEISTGRGIRPGTATITLRVPQHSQYLFFDEGKSIFDRWDEVSIWFKGYFTIASNSGGGLAGAAQDLLMGSKNYTYYRVFHGIITEVNPDITSRNQTIAIKAKTMLHWLDRVPKNNTGAVNSPSLANINEVNIPHFKNLKPVEAIVKLLQIYYYGELSLSTIYSNTNLKSLQRIDDDGNIQIFQNENQGPLKDVENINQKINTWWNEQRDKIVGRLRIFGLTNFDTKESDVKKRRRKIENEIGSFKDQSTRKVNPEHHFGRAVTNTSASFNAEQTQLKFNEQLIGDFYDQYLAQNLFGPKARISSLVNYREFNIDRDTLLDRIEYFIDLIGWEFYQDMNGDLVLKPPFYNLNTQPNRTQLVAGYETFDENIRENSDNVVTSYSVTARDFRSVRNNDNIAPTASVTDPYLTKQFDFQARSDSESSIVDKNFLQRFASFKMDQANLNLFGGSLTIIGRPEIQLGYPVYYEPLDTYFYVTGINHRLQVGSEFKTTLTLSAGRRKMQRPPESENVDETEDQLQNLYYVFQPGKNESSNGGLGSSSTGTSTGRKEFNLIPIASEGKLLRNTKHFAIFPDSYGYYKLISAETGKVPNARKADFNLRSFFFSDVLLLGNKSSFVVANTVTDIKAFKGWHFPVSDGLGFEHYGFHRYGARSILKKNGMVEAPARDLEEALERLESLVSPIDKAGRGLKDLVTPGKMIQGAKNLAKGVSELGALAAGPAHVWGIGKQNTPQIGDLRNLSYDSEYWAEGRGVLEDFKNSSNPLEAKAKRVAGAAKSLTTNVTDAIKGGMCSCILENSRWKL